mmetsp:Transcript_76212/g.227155  ORF Transcript_76212/g.227155 Transcript_76212/m.227155 type:complete len:214 (+) Transcript_76212:289-930(+)
MRFFMTASNMPWSTERSSHTRVSLTTPRWENASGPGPAMPWERETPLPRSANQASSCGARTSRPFLSCRACCGAPAAENFPENCSSRGAQRAPPSGRCSAGRQMETNCGSRGLGNWLRLPTMTTAIRGRPRPLAGWRPWRKSSSTLLSNAITSPFSWVKENSRPVAACRRVKSRVAPKLAMMDRSGLRFGLSASVPPSMDLSRWNLQSTEASS